MTMQIHKPRRPAATTRRKNKRCPGPRDALLALLVTLAGVSLVGCGDKPREIKLSGLQQLLAGPQGTNSTLWRGTFYCGTSGEFHYLRHTTRFNGDELLKIKTNELPIRVLGRFPMEKSQWVPIASLALTNR